MPLVHSWGPAAADAVPDLLAALPVAPWVTPAALAEIGPAALDAVPALREAAHTGQIRAGHAVWRLTGDAGPLISAASARLASSRSNLAWELDLVADAGPSAAPLVPALRGRLTGAPGAMYPERDEQIAAARLVWRATGDIRPVRQLPSIHHLVADEEVLTPTNNPEVSWPTVTPG
ncbi:hypothetical protein [Micromonospora sp. NPDC047730]|uniref:hypothetical protein n=1 Tax=Micromonospora sp. NPDC047730 TaxID=3364253 RepID=UPI0037145E9D